jgi:DnaJ-class molecular chaperone
MKFQKNSGNVQFNLFGCSACRGKGVVPWNGKMITCPICKGTKQDTLKGKLWLQR